MNWYYNNAGAAEGPMDDQAMTELVRAKRLTSDSLVWHAGLEAWQSVAVLAPAWWVASLPASPGRPAQAVKKPAKEKADAGARRLAGPNAPTTEAAGTKEGGGFLKRLFGFGKKKG